MTLIPPRLALSLVAAPLLFGLLSGGATSALADAPSVAAGDTLLTLTAEGKSTRAPDIATISAGVASTGATAGEAMAANATAMARVIAALKAAGIEDRDIQTSNLSLSPEYAQAPQGQASDAPPRITGYRASNSVSLRERHLDALGRAIDALVDAGANELNGPDFGLDHPDAAQDEARTAAVATARARADLYARAAGLHVLRILAISEEGSEEARPMPMMVMAARRAPTPVAAGEVDLSASVTVQFELAP